LRVKPSESSDERLATVFEPPAESSDETIALDVCLRFVSDVVTEFLVETASEACESASATPRLNIPWVAAPLLSYSIPNGITTFG
jgi:hypothetical protein